MKTLKQVIVLVKVLAGLGIIGIGTSLSIMAAYDTMPYLLSLDKPYDVTVTICYFVFNAILVVSGMVVVKESK